MKNYNVFYRIRRGHSRYAGDVSATTIDEAWSMAKTEHEEILNDKGMVEFYVANYNGDDHETMGIKNFMGSHHTPKPIKEAE